MSGGAPVVPTLRGIRLLLAAARQAGGALGATVELAILTLALPFEVVAMQFGSTDLGRAVSTVETRLRRKRTVFLAEPAIETITRLAGAADATGQIVTGGRGKAITSASVRMDRVRAALSAVSPEAGAVDWNFHGLRSAGAIALWRDAGPGSHVDLLLGRHARGGVTEESMAAAPLVGRGAAETWCRILLSEPAPGRAPRSGGGTGRG